MNRRRALNELVQLLVIAGVAPLDGGWRLTTLAAALARGPQMMAEPER